MNILIKPLITEKSLGRSKEGVYTFKVAKRAAKTLIKAEIEKLFKVKVKQIATITMKGKTKRAGKTRIKVQKTNWKKAIVTLEKNQKIDIFPVT